MTTLGVIDFLARKNDGSTVGDGGGVQRHLDAAIATDRFPETVLGKVLGAISAKVHGLGDWVGGLAAATRYYLMARFSYGYADVDIDEANSLARSAGIELGNGLSRGRTAGR